MNRAAGPALRTGTAGSQDESRCGGIHEPPQSIWGRARRNFLELSWGWGGICNESYAGPSNRLR